LRVNWFKTLDFPELERPAMATSGAPSIGQSLRVGALVKKCAMMRSGRPPIPSTLVYNPRASASH